MEYLISFQDVMDLKFKGGIYGCEKCIALRYNETLIQFMNEYKFKDRYKRKMPEDIDHNWIIIILPIVLEYTYHYVVNHIPHWGKIYILKNCKCGSEFRAIDTFFGREYYCPKCLR